MTKIEMYKTDIKMSVAVICLLLIQPVVFAAGQKNLALHRRVDYSPKAEYSLTVHPRDPYLLTDGIKDESLWLEKYREKTVGWLRPGFIEIKIDLGQISNVGEVNVYTVGGGRADVEYPEYIIASSSLDGQQYVFSGFATSDGWDFGVNLTKPKVITLTVEQKARYITLLVRPTGIYFFTDEIEVIESPSPEPDRSSRDSLSKDRIIDLVERARQLQRDMDVLRGKFSPAKDEIAFREMEKKIDGLRQRTRFDAMAEIESEFSTFRSGLLRSVCKTDWVCYQAEPMDILRYGDIPADVPPADFTVSLYQWQNEYGAAALNLVNCSSGPINFSVNLSPLRDPDKEIDSKDIFQLRRARYVRVLHAGLVADPLVLQNSKPFPVAPGETVQLWLEAYSRGLGPGHYTAAMAIDASGESIAKPRQTVPIQIEIADKMFPEKVPFFSCNWDYITRSDRFTRNNPKVAAADLNNHYINVCVIEPYTIYAKRGAELPGQYILPSKLEAEIGLHKNSRIYLLWLGIEWGLKDHFGQFKTPKGEYTVEWKNNFRIFLGQLRDFMLNHGFGYDRFALYLLDESVGEDFIYAAQIIRDFDPRLKIYANNWIEPGEFNKVKDLIDIWCPHIPNVLDNQGTFEKYRSSGVFDEIWSYHCNIAAERFFAPSKSRTSREWRGDNRVFWRTMPMVAASLEMTGAGFWVYQDADRTGWIKDKKGEHGVVYDGTVNPDKNCIAEMIVPSKRWQQWRQGIEDAVCLSGRKDLLNEFFQRPASQLSSDYLTSLRKRADEK